MRNNYQNFLNGGRMQNNFKLVDLSLVLRGLHKARQEWLATIDKKAAEMMEANPKLSNEKARNEALTHPEVFEVFQRVLNLYSCIGGDAEAYIGALDSVAQNAEVIPLKKAG